MGCWGGVCCRGGTGVRTVAAPGVVRGMGDGVCAAGYRLTVSFCVVAPAGVRTRTM